MKNKISLVVVTSLLILTITACKGSRASSSRSKSDDSSVVKLNVGVENGYLVYKPVSGDPEFSSWTGEVVPHSMDVMSTDSSGTLVASALKYRVKGVVKRANKDLTCTSSTFTAGVSAISFTCDGPVKDNVAKDTVATNLTCQCVAKPQFVDAREEKPFNSQVASEEACGFLTRKTQQIDGKNYTLEQCVTVNIPPPAPAAMSCSCDVYEAQEYYRVGSITAEILRNEKVDLAKYSGKQSCSDINEKFADDKNNELYANCK